MLSASVRGYTKVFQRNLGLTSDVKTLYNKSWLMDTTEASLRVKSIESSSTIFITLLTINFVTRLTEATEAAFRVEIFEPSFYTF